MTRTEASQAWALPPGGRPLEVLAVELDEFWCSDCRTRALFERIAADGDDSQWACTACGAAYFDAIDLGVETPEARAGQQIA